MKRTYQNRTALLLALALSSGACSGPEPGSLGTTAGAPAAGQAALGGAAQASVGGAGGAPSASTGGSFAAGAGAASTLGGMAGLGGVPAGGVAGSAGAGAVLGEVSLSRDIAPFITSTCGLAGCHVAGSAQWHGMNLVSAADIYAGWVNKSGFDHCNEEKGGDLEFPTRVTPLALGPLDSYILVKVTGPEQLCGDASYQMPPPASSAYWEAGVTPTSPLSGQQIDLLKQWIQQGAKNN